MRDELTPEKSHSSVLIQTSCFEFVDVEWQDPVHLLFHH